MRYKLLGMQKLPVENLGGFVQDSIGWNDRIRRHRPFAHKKWGCAGLKWHNLTFYNSGQRLLNIPCNILLFCVSCDDDDNRSNGLHAHNLHSFCILHFCGNFCIPSSLYRIYTLGRYSLRNSILFSLFPFLFCPFVQTGSHSRLKKRGHKSIRFSS